MSMYFVYYALFSLAIGFLMAFWAKRQHKNHYKWFALGTVLSLFGIILFVFTRDKVIDNNSN